MLEEDMLLYDPTDDFDENSDSTENEVIENPEENNEESTTEKTANSLIVTIGGIASIVLFCVHVVIMCKSCAGI
jgi:hypothetical protein